MLIYVSESSHAEMERKLSNKNRVLVYSDDPKDQAIMSGKAESDAFEAQQKALVAENKFVIVFRIEKNGRGGKTVTLVTGFVGIGLPEKESLAKKMRNACGCGGTVKDGEIEIQGDQREKIAAILTDAGFKPVFAGG